MDRPQPIGPALASHVLDHLKENPEYCIEVKGRIGGLPAVRHRDGEWQYATVAGAGELMTGTHEEDDVKSLVMSGPQVELRRVDELACWECWPEGRQKA